MGRVRARSSPPPGPQLPSPSITSLGKYLFPPFPQAAACCFLFLPSCKAAGGGYSSPLPLEIWGSQASPLTSLLVLEAQRPSHLPSEFHLPLPVPSLPPVSLPSSFHSCLPHLLPPLDSAPGSLPSTPVLPSLLSPSFPATHLTSFFTFPLPVSLPPRLPFP